MAAKVKKFRNRISERGFHTTILFESKKLKEDAKPLANGQGMTIVVRNSVACLSRLEAVH